MLLNYNDRVITQREDGFVNLTQMAKANDKRLDNYFRLETTTLYLKALESSLRSEGSILIKASKDHNSPDFGTWGHPLIAIHFAQWISPEFHVWCNRHIKTLIETGKTELPKQKTMTLQDYREVKEYLDNCDDPIFVSAMTQRMYEELGSNILPASKRHVLVAVKARDMGYTLKPGQDGLLGKHVKRYIKPSGKAPHGRYEVNTYEDTDYLREVIHNFFNQ